MPPSPPPLSGLWLRGLAPPTNRGYGRWVTHPSPNTRACQEEEEEEEEEEEAAARNVCRARREIPRDRNGAPVGERRLCGT